MSETIKIDKGMVIIGAAFVVLIGGIFVVATQQNGGDSSDGSYKLPKGPVHWHPKLTIYINGEKQVIPANVGLGSQYADSPFYDPMMQMTEIHTHATDGILHWELMHGAKSVDDLRLDNFFQVWGKTFNSECVFEYCNNDGKTAKMFVNGQPNSDYENYIVKDSDDIVIRYE